MSDHDILLTDDNFGERLVRGGIYTYRDTNLTIDQYLISEKRKPRANRGSLTVARDIRRLFELLGLILVDIDKQVTITESGLQLLTANEEQIKNCWRNAFLQLGLEGSDGEISHPYRILLNIINLFPGIETRKLLLALEAENDSEAEMSRIYSLIDHDFNEIVQSVGTTPSLASDAVKILPGIAEQLGDIERVNNKAYPVNQTIITEDEITSIIPEKKLGTVSKPQFWDTTAQEIAKDPLVKNIEAVTIDISDAIRIRQQRLSEHQRCVRLLAKFNEDSGCTIYEGKFDCLAVNRKDKAFLYEVKTLSESLADLETQTIKAVGQIKYYAYSIVQEQMGLSDIKEIVVYTRQPTIDIIEFCFSIGIYVIWLEGDDFKFLNPDTNKSENLNFKDFTK